MAKFAALVITLAEYAENNTNGDVLQLVADKLDVNRYARKDRLEELKKELDEEANARPRTVLTLG